MSNRSRSAQTKPTSAAALPDRKARFSPSINYSSVGPSVRELLQQRYSRSGSKSRSRAEKHKPRPRPKSKRRPSVDDEEAQTEQIDSELVRNKTLTIFSTATFTGVLQQIAQKHATKLIKEIEDKFHDESLSSSSSSSDDGSNDDSDSESSEISTYELPQEPEFPIVRFLALLAAFPVPFELKVLLFFVIVARSSFGLSQRVAHTIPNRSWTEQPLLQAFV